MASFVCPHCTSVCTLPDDAAGRIFRCPHCSSSFAAGTGAVSAFADLDERRPRLVRIPRPDRTATGHFVLLAVSLLGVLIFIAGFLVYQDRRNENRIERARLVKQLDVLLNEEAFLQDSIRERPASDRPALERQLKRLRAESESLARRLDRLWP